MKRAARLCLSMMCGLTPLLCWGCFNFEAPPLEPSEGGGMSGGVSPAQGACEEEAKRCRGSIREVCVRGVWGSLPCPPSQMCVELEERGVCVDREPPVDAGVPVTGGAGGEGAGSAPPAAVEGGGEAGVMGGAAAGAAPAPALSPPPPCSSSPAGCPAIEWVTIEGGTFNMGSTKHSDEQPIRSVTVPSFQMMRTEVTVGMYRSCVNAGACEPPACAGSRTDSGDRCNYGANATEHPANYLSWRQLMTFAAWVGARLPTEAEWEFAASSRGEGLYPWGAESPSCALTDYSSDGSVSLSCNGVGTSPTCSATSGDSAQGLCDMAGNVWEWVQDEHHNNYESAPSDGGGWCVGACPTSASDPAYNANDAVRRSLRGGAWLSVADYLRAANRYNHAPTYNDDLTGGRLARAVP